MIASLDALVRELAESTDDHFYLVISVHRSSRDASAHVHVSASRARKPRDGETIPEGNAYAVDGMLDVKAEIATQAAAPCYGKHWCTECWEDGDSVENPEHENPVIGGPGYVLRQGA